MNKSEIINKIMAERPEGEFIYPADPCIDCFIASWVDIYGVWVYGCVPTHCIKADNYD